jgi:hypothetical protein
MSLRSGAARLGRVPAYPVVFAVAWIVDNWATSSVPLTAIWRPLLVVTVIALGLLAASVAIWRRRVAMGAYLCGTLIMVMTLQWPLGAPLLALGVWWLLIRGLRRMQGRAQPGTFPAEAALPFLNVVSMAWLAYAVAMAGFVLAAPGPRLPAAAFTIGGDRPNVYLVLLDGYPRADTLANLFDFDNSPFISALGERGFTVASNSRSNYPQTQVTLATMFNGNYADALGFRPTTSASGDLRLLHAAISDGALLSGWRASGYRIVTSVSSFSDASVSDADVVLDGGQLSEWETFLIQRSVLAGVIELSGSSVLEDSQRSRNDGNLADLRAIAASARSAHTVAFVHIVSPHPPFLRDAHGNPLPAPRCFPGSCTLWQPTAAGRGMTVQEYGARLGDRITFLNQRVLAAVDDVVAADPTAVIILFSDHGSRYDDADRPEQFRSFFAARTPGRTDVFPDDVTTTNILRDLVTAYSDTDLPTLPYRAWIPDPQHLLVLTPYP